MYYTPVRGMIEILDTVSSIDNFDGQYVKRSDYETQLIHAFDRGKRLGAEEKSLDYQAAKESRLYAERRVLNTAIEHLKLSLEKLENCKANL